MLHSSQRVHNASWALLKHRCVCVCVCSHSTFTHTWSIFKTASVSVWRLAGLNGHRETLFDINSRLWFTPKPQWKQVSVSSDALRSQWAVNRRQRKRLFHIHEEIPRNRERNELKNQQRHFFSTLHDVNKNVILQRKQLSQQPLVSPSAACASTRAGGLHTGLALMDGGARWNPQQHGTNPSAARSHAITARAVHLISYF